MLKQTVITMTMLAMMANAAQAHVGSCRHLYGGVKAWFPAIDSSFQAVEDVHESPAMIIPNGIYTALATGAPLPDLDWDAREQREFWQAVIRLKSRSWGMITELELFFDALGEFNNCVAHD